MDDGGDGNLYYSQRKDSTWTKIKKPWQRDQYNILGISRLITPDGKPCILPATDQEVQENLISGFQKKMTTDTGSILWIVVLLLTHPIMRILRFLTHQPIHWHSSSIGHLGMGGYDVFRSIKRMESGPNLSGLPYSFNNTLDNTFFILNNNSTGYITSLYNEQDKSRNIYSISAEDNTDKTISANGTVSLQDGMPVDPVQMTIQLFDQKTGILLKNISVVDSASFKYVMKQVSLRSW